MLLRLAGTLLALVLCWSSTATAQFDSQPDSQTASANFAPADEDAVFLVARPAFRDAGYRHTVLIATPLPGGGHIGVIINRPTSRSLFSLFPEHPPSKNVAETVRYGGPFSSSALIALLRSEVPPGEGALQVMKNLFIVFRASTIDKVIEQTPNAARYYVGYVGWVPGELKAEIDRGLWTIARADRDTIFQKDLSELWEDLIAQSRQTQARNRGKHSLPPVLARNRGRPSPPPVPPG